MSSSKESSNRGSIFPSIPPYFDHPDFNGEERHKRDIQRVRQVSSFGPNESKSEKFLQIARDGVEYHGRLSKELMISAMVEANKAGGKLSTGRQNRIRSLIAGSRLDGVCMSAYFEGWAAASTDPGDFTPSVGQAMGMALENLNPSTTSSRGVSNASRTVPSMPATSFGNLPPATNYSYGLPGSSGNQFTMQPSQPSPSGYSASPTGYPGGHPSGSSNSGSAMQSSSGGVPQADMTVFLDSGEPASATFSSDSSPSGPSPLNAQGGDPRKGSEASPWVIE